MLDAPAQLGQVHEPLDWRVLGQGGEPVLGWLALAWWPLRQQPADRVLLPGYGPVRLMVDGAYSPLFHAPSELLLSLAWATTLGVGVYVVLRRAVGVRSLGSSPV